MSAIGGKAGLLIGPDLVAFDGKDSVRFDL